MMQFEVSSRFFSHVSRVTCLDVIMTCINESFEQIFWIFCASWYLLDTMMKSVTFALVAVALCLESVAGFANQPEKHVRQSNTLEMKAEKQIAVGVAAATLLLAGNWMLLADQAMAVDFGGGSTQVIAARSGGRVGGRSFSGRSSYSAPRTTYRSSTTIVRPMIAPPPVVVSPFGSPFGYGYNPLGGFGK
jgi:hypothetical protein